MNKPSALAAAAAAPTPRQDHQADAFAKQGFASTGLVTRWPDIVGPEIAAHAEPIEDPMAAPRPRGRAGSPATLVLRVEGPAAIEIQHLSGVILERVNRFFGWQAVGRIGLRQAPLARRKAKKPPPPRSIPRGRAGRRR